MTEDADELAAACARVAALGGGEPRRAARLAGGRNAQVFRVDLAGGGRVVLKRFADRARFDREARALAFFAEVGLDSVPELRAVDEGSLELVMGWVPGEPPGAVEEQDVEDLVGFVLRVTDEGRRRGAEFDRASEACFSRRELLENLEWRRARLGAEARPAPGLAAGLAELLEARLPATQEELAARPRGPCEELLAPALRVLSPSDLGFHNALRLPDGSLALVDFEHFGWDDPAKTIADFLLHPGMGLSPELRGAFATGMRAARTEDVHLGERVFDLLPLYALKWSLILLNEFLPGDRERRRRAGAEGGTLQAGQLQRAAAMVARAGRLGRARDLPTMLGALADEASAPPGLRR